MGTPTTLTRLWIASLRCHIWGGQGLRSPKEAAMRLVAAACTLVVVAFLAVFGAILLHERTNAGPGPFAPSPNAAATAQAPAPRALPTSPVSTVSASPVSTAPVAIAAAVSSNAILPAPQA